MHHRNHTLIYVSLELLLEVLMLSANGKVVQLHGAGASFPSEVYSRWTAAYKQYRVAHVTLNMTYKDIGSGAGKQMIMEDNNSSPSITYAGSDIPLSEAEQNEFPDLRSFPVMAGAILIAFNIKNVEYLNLSISALTGIYNGSIQYWNHQLIQDMNPAYQLPDKEITVIARSDNSGTTYSFTSALVAGSSSWETEYGVFSEGLDANGRPLKWNNSVVDFYGYVNRGMTGLILSLPYSIGYATIADVFYAKLKYALIQNFAGNFVRASKETVQDAILNSGSGLSLLNPEGPFSYPIAAYTFFIIKQSQLADCSSAIEFVRYVDWFYTSQTAQVECEKLFMVPMEPHVAENISRFYLQTITCKGKNVWSLFENQRKLELKQPELDSTSVYIVISTLSVIVTVCIFIFGRQRWIHYKDILNDTWYIKFADISFEREHIVQVRTCFSSPGFDPTRVAVESPLIQYAWETNSIKIGMFNSELIFSVKSDSELNTSTFKAKKTLVWFRDEINHCNVAKLVGLTRSSIRWFSIYRGQIRGPIMDIIRSPSVMLSSSGLVVLCKEIILGMEYLHKKEIVHGNLKASCCFVDIAWKVKITDWHEAKFKACTKSENLSRYNYKKCNVSDDQIIALFWVAPEIIKFQRYLTQEGDVYSFGIVMQELFSKCDPYSEISLPPKEILNAILTCSLRPKFPENTPLALRTLMEQTWEMDPVARPSFSELHETMEGKYPNDNSLTDCILKSIEEYASFLERQLSNAKEENVQAHETSEAAMLENAPPLVVERFLKNESIEPSSHKFGAILACSFVNLTQFISLLSAHAVLDTLEELLIAIDQIVLAQHVSKLSVNGENLLFASDPKAPSITQIQSVSAFAIMVMNYMERISQKRSGRCILHMKMGLATGSILVCVTGKKIPKYLLVGEAVSLAFKMLSEAQERSIRLSRSMYGMVKESSPMFETCILKGGSEEDDSDSYWLLSAKGLEGRFSPSISG